MKRGERHGCASLGLRHIHIHLFIYIYIYIYIIFFFRYLYLQRCIFRASSVLIQLHSRVCIGTCAHAVYANFTIIWIHASANYLYNFLDVCTFRITTNRSTRSARTEMLVFTRHLPVCIKLVEHYYLNLLFSTTKKKTKRKRKRYLSWSRLSFDVSHTYTLSPSFSLARAYTYTLSSSRSLFLSSSHERSIHSGYNRCLRRSWELLENATMSMQYYHSQLLRNSRIHALMEF